MSPWISITPNVLWVVLGMLVTLATGTLIRIRGLRGAAAELAGNRLSSLRSWWIVAALVIAAALSGVAGSCLLSAVVSGLALIEFLRLTREDLPRAARWLAFALIPAHYFLIWLNWSPAQAVFLPLASVMLLGLAMVASRRTAGFRAAAGGAVWGLLITTYLLSHVVLLFRLPVAGDAAGGAGWFLLVILVTEGSDIMQALVGRKFGRRKLARVVSPHKTWEGFAGGVAAATLVAMLIAPWLTPLNLWQAALGGLLIAVVGLFGDLNISALKRDAGVKDSGTLLPGQGGVLDRVDSLTFTAPVFYYFARIMLG